MQTDASDPLAEHSMRIKAENGLSEGSLYAGDLKYLESSTYIVIIEMLERLPNLKVRIKKYLETFPE